MRRCENHLRPRLSIFLPFKNSHQRPEEIMIEISYLYYFPFSSNTIQQNLKPNHTKKVLHPRHHSARKPLHLCFYATLFVSQFSHFLPYLSDSFLIVRLSLCVRIILAAFASSWPSPPGPLVFLHRFTFPFSSSVVIIVYFG